MKIKAYGRFKKSYQHLPLDIQKKVDKQLILMINNSFKKGLNREICKSIYKIEKPYGLPQKGAKGAKK